MPVNTAYLNVGAPPIGMVSQFTVALVATGVPAASGSDSGFSIPARLLPINKSTGSYLNPGTLVLVGADSAISAQLSFNAFVVPATNSVFIHFSNATTSVVTQRAGTWGIGLLQGLP